MCLYACACACMSHAYNGKPSDPRIPRAVAFVNVLEVNEGIVITANVDKLFTHTICCLCICTFICIYHVFRFTPIPTASSLTPMPEVFVCVCMCMCMCVYISSQTLLRVVCVACM